MANTQMERCPTCGSDRNGKRPLGYYVQEACRNVWHSTPAAPETPPDQKIVEASRIGLGIVGAQLRAIPHQNAQGWNRYDCDAEHVLHVWADGKSYDIRVPKEEFLGAETPRKEEA